MPTIYDADQPDEEKPKASKPRESSMEKSSSTSKKPSRKQSPKTNKKKYRRIANGVKAKAGVSVNPSGIHFANRKEDEEVLLMLRRHPVTNFVWLAIFVLMIFLISPAINFGWLNFLPANFRIVSFYAWLLLALIVFWSGLVDWYFNVNIISDERVLDIDFYNLIYREVTDAEIEKVQDVTHNMGGLFGLIFNYGDVYIQTAAAKPEIEFLNIPQPAEVASVLREIQEEVRADEL